MQIQKIPLKNVQNPDLQTLYGSIENTTRSPSKHELELPEGEQETTNLTQMLHAMDSHGEEPMQPQWTSSKLDELKLG